MTIVNMSEFAAAAACAVADVLPVFHGCDDARPLRNALLEVDPDDTVLDIPIYRGSCWCCGETDISEYPASVCNACGKPGMEWS